MVTFPLVWIPSPPWVGIDQVEARGYSFGSGLMWTWMARVCSSFAFIGLVISWFLFLIGEIFVPSLNKVLHPLMVKTKK